MRTKEELEDVAGTLLAAMIHVHRALGLGLLESASSACLRCEPTKRGLRAAREVSQPIRYDGVEIDAGYRIDLLVEDEIFVENKSVKELAPIHTAL